MNLLRYESETEATVMMGDELGSCMTTSLVLSPAQYGEADADGNIPTISAEVKLPGYWLLTDLDGLPSQIAFLREARIIETGVQDIIGCTLSPIPAGWPTSALAMESASEIDEGGLKPLTARRLRLGLVMHGIGTETVAEKIAQIADEQTRNIARIEWEYATEFDRDHPLIAQVGGALGLTNEQINAMWVASSTL